MKKFTQNDVFVNTMKTYPKVRIFVNSGEIYYNGTTKNGPQLNDYLETPPVEVPLVAIDGFEYIGGWPDTIADITYPTTFSFASPVATGTENFESGW